MPTMALCPSLLYVSLNEAVVGNVNVDVTYSLNGRMTSL